MQIEFGINYNVKGNTEMSLYLYSECDHFIECASDETGSHWEKYREFLRLVLSGKVTKKTLVERDILEEFQRDLDNRAQIDYREGHWDDDPVIFNGGAKMDQLAKDLRTWLDKVHYHHVAMIDFDN